MISRLRVSAGPDLVLKRLASLDCHGGAIPLAFWAITILTGAILAWAAWIYQGTKLASEAMLDTEARVMARSGVTVALHPQVTKFTALLTHDFTPDSGYKVEMIGEGGRLNLAWILTGEDPRKLNLFKQWLEYRGLDYYQREVLVDSLLDYVDSDDAVRVNGREAKDDYVPANRPLQSVDELKQVYGTDPLTRQPGWRDKLTLLSQGPIDVAAADEDVLRLIPGFGEARLQRFLQVRAGADQQFGTEDDVQFQNLEDVRSVMGLSQAQFQELGGLIMVNDPTWHLAAKGRSGKVIRQIEVVARKTGQNPQILSWKE
jgi:hypothetical protein